MECYTHYELTYSFVATPLYARIDWLYYSLILPKDLMKYIPQQQLIFGPRAEEIIWSPVEELISIDGGFGAFILTRIAGLYGKPLNLLWVSGSSMSLQPADISNQADAILGVPNLPLQIPAATPYGIYFYGTVFSSYLSKQICRTDRVILMLSTVMFSFSLLFSRATAYRYYNNSRCARHSVISRTMW
jgi:hypothetical protein